MTSLIAGACLLSVMHGSVSTGVLLGWTFAMLVHQGLRAYYHRRYVRTKLEFDNVPHWSRLYVLSTTLSGVLWGSAGVLFYVPGSLPQQAYLCMMLFAVAAVSIQSLSIYPPAFYPVIALTLPPFMLRAFVGGSPSEIALAIPMVIALFASWAFGRSNHLAGYESIRRRFENIDLITELQHQRAIAERARSQAEATNRSKTRFFAAASHDLRQPLHAMGLFAAALANRIHDAEALNIVKNINASVDALEALFNELLDISRIDAGIIRAQSVDFPLGRIFDRLRAEFETEAAAKGLKLRLMRCKQMVRSDPMLVERILRNLISNAIRYTSEGGVAIGCRKSGAKLRVEVWDSGIGISADQRERIFEEFYQIGDPQRGSRKGLGLGLPIVRRLAHLLDTEIQLSSTLGTGSVFRLELLRGRALSESKDRVGVEAQSADLHGKLIIVIDDECAIVEGMQMMLSGWGAEVLASTTGTDLIERIHLAGRLPDLIIADYRLTEGRTGIEVIAQLRRELDPEIPAILVTGSTTAGHISEADMQSLHLLLKPVPPAKLRALIHFKLRETPARLLAIATSKTV
jgi:signal transduction histidine kinase